MVLVFDLVNYDLSFLFTRCNSSIIIKPLLHASLKKFKSSAHINKKRRVHVEMEKGIVGRKMA